jgi:hypothetical protein
MLGSCTCSLLLLRDAWREEDAGCLFVHSSLHHAKEPPHRLAVGLLFPLMHRYENETKPALSKRYLLKVMIAGERQ